MKIEIAHFDINDPRYQDCLKLRYEILRQPLGMQITAQDLEKDPASTHILLCVEGKPAGTVALHENHLRQMAVLESFRGQNLGRKLVAYLEQLATAEEIILEARDYAIPFYKKCGYSEFGEFFEKIGILHIMMRKEI